MSEVGRRRRPFAELAGWVFIPVLALILVYSVADAALPASDCDGISDEASGFAQGIALLVTAGASLLCLAAAARHFVRLRRAGSVAASPAIALGAAVVLFGALLISTGNEAIVPFVVVGLIATALCFVVLAGFVAARRTIDEVGVVLPLYLTGMAVFLYPAVLLLFAIGNSGLGC